MKKNGVWTLVRCQEVLQNSIMTSKAVLKVKANGERHVRICARGFSQVPGRDYVEGQTAASTPQRSTVLVFFALAAWTGWRIRQLDVEAAFSCCGRTRAAPSS